MSRRDEADEVRDALIRWQRQLIAALLAVLVLGTLAAILGGPAAVGALQAVQVAAGVTP